VTSLKELLLFLAQALRNQARGDRQTACATLVLGNCQDLAARTRGPLDKSAARAAVPPTLRGRRKGTES
jgi:hypothetical protein